MQSWREWLAEQRTASKMQVEVVPLQSILSGKWDWRGDGWCIGQDPSAFFNIVGLDIKKGTGGWQQPALQEVGRGIVVLPRCGNEFLLQAKADPGNEHGKGYVLLAAALQASESNLERAHGGNAPPRDRLLLRVANELFLWPSDGNRHFNKYNRHAVLEVKNKGEVEPLLSTESWFTLEELREAVRAGDANQHLRETMALLV